MSTVYAETKWINGEFKIVFKLSEPLDFSDGGLYRAVMTTEVKLIEG